MGEQERLDMILAQARIAKAALHDVQRDSGAKENTQLDQAILALEAIVLLADPDFNMTSNAA